MVFIITASRASTFIQHGAGLFFHGKNTAVDGFAKQNAANKEQIVVLGSSIHLTNQTKNCKC
ncbi:hypothetical protein DYI25_06345 [Mesobacillus boroniphilus]|uniref:Uncharacterized protein n=1 Tax=Mesobacillus boroniphilus TaxID=308892 RepID=A0A944GVW8_9BACI|nr:hypothetical protein [Mesobacillus boroniphilus]